MGEVIKFPGAQLNLGLPPQREVLNRPGPPTRRRPVCHACGLDRPVPGERYCTKCITVGKNNPWVNCRDEACTLVTKRQYPGQQFFWCPAHRSGAGA